MAALQAVKNKPKNSSPGDQHRNKDQNSHQ